MGWAFQPVQEEAHRCREARAGMRCTPGGRKEVGPANSQSQCRGSEERIRGKTLPLAILPQAKQRQAFLQNQGPRASPHGPLGLHCVPLHAPLPPGLPSGWQRWLRGWALLGSNPD